MQRGSLEGEGGGGCGYILKHGGCLDRSLYFSKCYISGGRWGKKLERKKKDKCIKNSVKIKFKGGG